MPITASIPRVSYISTAGQTTFPYTWMITDAAELRVYANGQLMQLSVHYNVTGIGASGGGNVVSFSPPATGASVVILGQLAIDQDLDLTDHGPFPAASVESALDKSARIDQQLQEQINRAVKLGPSSLLGPITLPEPTSLTTSAGGKKALVYNDAGTNLSLIELVMQSGLVGDVIPIVTQATLGPAGDTGRIRYVSDIKALAVDQGGIWHLFTSIDELVVPTATRATLPNPTTIAGRARYLSDTPKALAISDGSTWLEVPVGGIVMIAPPIALTAPPSAAPAGQLARVTDVFRGLALSTGTAWVSVNSPVFRPGNYAGAGIGAQMNACVADMPVSGGIIDCRGFGGGATWESTVTVDKPVVFLFGHTTFTVTAAAMLKSVGAGRLALLGAGIYATTFISQSATPALIEHTANAQLQIENLLFQTSVTQTGGFAIALAPTTYANHHRIARCGFDGYYRSVIIGNANSIVIDHCGFANCRFSGIETQYIPAAPDSGQLFVTNCIWDSSDAASTATCILSANSSGLYVHNCTILQHAYGIVVQCSTNDAFNEFDFYNNRISHQRFYNIVFNRLSGTGSLNGIHISDNQLGGTSSEFAACIGLPVPNATYVDRCHITGNDFVMNSAGDMGCELAGGNHITVGGNIFTAGNPLAVAISVGTIAQVRCLPNTYAGFVQNASVTYQAGGNIVYAPTVIPTTIVVNPPNIPSNQVGFVDVTVTGLSATHPDTVILTPPADLESGLIPLPPMIPFDNVLRIFLWNIDTSPLNGAPRVWKMQWSDVIV